MLDKLTINHFPKTDYATEEALNTLWTNLFYSGSNMRVFAFTSCRPDEGKSFVVMNLARTIAETGKKVLVIDADLRKSVLLGRHRITSKSGDIVGLAHYLTGQYTAEEILYDTNIANLSLMPAGHEILNPFALLEAPHFPNLLGRVLAYFDIVLVDTPPVGTVIDGAILARYCDGTVLVVKHNTISRKEVTLAKSQVEKVGGRVLGVVLNDVAFQSYGMNKYYYKAYYNYGTSRRNKKK